MRVFMTWFVVPVLLITFGAAVAQAQDELPAPPPPLTLTNIASADIRRIDEGPLVRVLITVNLVSGAPFKIDYFISQADITAFKNGTNPEKAAIRRKYIRQAVRTYLASATPPTPVDQGSQNVSKAQISEAGDTP